MLQVQSLSCRRGGREVVREVGFRLSAGEAMLVTGSNGSGKSSLLRVLAGLLRAETGNISWNGQNIADDATAYRSNLRYVGHLDAVKPELTVSETLNYWRVLQCADAIAADPFGIAKLANKPVRYLSEGQKRRLSLSRLMLGKSAFWILDEPTTTLDAVGQTILFDCIARHRDKGGLAIIATHHDLEIPNTARYEMRAR